VKAALHRGRGKLADDADPAASRVVAPAVLDAFCSAFQARDLDRLAALLLDHASIEVVGATTQYGPEAAKRAVLWGMLFGVERLVKGEGIDPRFVAGARDAAPRVELREHRGEWLLVHWYAHDDGEFVRGLTRATVEGDRIAHLANYFYNPDVIAEVCRELGLPHRPNGHRSCAPR
jgi:RNA polymerase sigma-70 factor (ECF subfamily)